jgi:hypothetical protein
VWVPAPGTTWQWQLTTPVDLSACSNFSAGEQCAECNECSALRPFFQAVRDQRTSRKMITEIRG